jgi:hypothetical protein
MANKRRTKKQKLAATTRHNYEGQLTIATGGSSSTHFTISTQASQPQTESSTRDRFLPSHTYVVSDVRKTLTITTFLILLDLAIYFLLKLRFISIPGIGF